MSIHSVRPGLQHQVTLGDIHVDFHRTLRIPDDGQTYPLPPSLGSFPLKRAADYAGRVPASWGQSDLFLPMRQSEALWLSFSGPHWKPSALQIFAGGVNAVTGGRQEDGLTGGDDQNYMVVPGQPWIDGFKTEEGSIRQFVAMPLGQGYTAEAQVTGEEKTGGIQLRLFKARPGVFPDTPPKSGGIRFRSASFDGGDMVLCASYSAQSVGEASFSPDSAGGGAQMGLGGGGRMTQSIYPDRHGVESWESDATETATVHIVNSAMYEAITGEAAPESPVSAKTYTQYGYPWFALYDEPLGDLAPSTTLAGLKSVAQIDAEHGNASAEPESVDWGQKAPGPDPVMITE